jgi:hypothetical protein
MDNLTIGQCLCGTVRFQISGAFDRFFLCHCGRCRKDTGAAHSANLFASRATLTWLEGQDNVRVFRLSETRHAKSFCMTCGSALPFMQENDTVLVVPAGSLDGATGIAPEAHICHGSRAPWDDDLGSLPMIDGLPG